MSKTNPVMLNGLGVTEDGATLAHGDEVIFPQGEDARLVFRVEMLSEMKNLSPGKILAKAFSPAKDAAAHNANASASSPGARSPLGERNGEEMAPSPKKADAAPRPSAAVAARSPSAAAPSPARFGKPSPAKKSKLSSSSTCSPGSAAKGNKSPAGATPHTKAARALVATAVASIVDADAAAAAKLKGSKSPAKARSPALKSPTPKKTAAKSPKSPAKSPRRVPLPADSTPKSAGPTPHTRAARDLVDAVVDSMCAEEAEAADEPASVTKRSPAGAGGAKKSPAKSPKSRQQQRAASKSPNGPTPHTKAAKALVSDAIDAIVKDAEVRSISPWSPYDRAGVVNADP